LSEVPEELVVFAEQILPWGSGLDGFCFIARRELVFARAPGLRGGCGHGGSRADRSAVLRTAGNLSSV